MKKKMDNNQSLFRPILFDFLAIMAQNEVHRFRRWNGDTLFEIGGRCCGSHRNRAASALRQVCLHVEIAEQHQERDHVADEQIVHPQREFAVIVKGDTRRGHGDGELDQLDHGQIALPPQILGDRRSHGGQCIVQVHYHVHRWVDHGRQEGCWCACGYCGYDINELSAFVSWPFARAFDLTWTARHPLDTYPPKREHGTVVVHVQERQLVVLAAQHEEKRVHELEQLGEVEPPDGLRDLHSAIG